MTWCMACRSVAGVDPARPAGPSRCRLASRRRITGSGRALPVSSSLASCRIRSRPAGRKLSGTWDISPLPRPCSMTWQNW